MTDERIKEIASKGIEDMAVSIYNQAVDDIADAVMKIPSYGDKKLIGTKLYFSNFIKKQKL